MNKNKERRVDGFAMASYILIIFSTISLITFYWCDLFSPKGSMFCSLCIFEDRALCFHTNHTSSYRILDIFLLPSKITLVIGVIGLIINKNKDQTNRNLAKKVIFVSILLLLLGGGCYYLLPNIFFFGF